MLSIDIGDGEGIEEGGKMAVVRGEEGESGGEGGGSGEPLEDALGADLGGGKAGDEAIAGLAIVVGLDAKTLLVGKDGGEIVNPEARDADFGGGGDAGGIGPNFLGDVLCGKKGAPEGRGSKGPLGGSACRAEGFAAGACEGLALWGEGEEASVGGIIGLDGGALSMAREKNATAREFPSRCGSLCIIHHGRGFLSTRRRNRDRRDGLAARRILRRGEGRPRRGWRRALLRP